MRREELMTFVDYLPDLRVLPEPNSWDKIDRFMPDYCCCSAFPGILVLILDRVLGYSATCHSPHIAEDTGRIAVHR